MVELVEHHIKYKEIHGIDETIWMEKGEHRKLHNKLRKEGRCDMSVDKLGKIADAAYHRTAKAKKLSKLRGRKYDQSEAGKKCRREYRERNIQRIIFSELLIPNVKLLEELRYNNKIGSVTWSSYFKANNGKKLFYIELGDNKHES